MFNPLIKLYFRGVFGWFTSQYQKNDMIFLNAGYADLESDDGVYLKTYKDKFDVLRFQLYDYVVKRFGRVDNLNGLSLLETGCGRGGGLHYLARELNPHSAIGVDISKAQVSSYSYFSNY